MDHLGDGRGDQPTYDPHVSLYDDEAKRAEIYSLNGYL